MKYFFLLALLYFTDTVSAQVSVFSCQDNTQVTQVQIAPTSVFQQQCIEFPDTQTFLFNGTMNNDVRANKEIKIEPGFQAGTYSSTGQLKLSILPSDFDVAVMNYPDMTHILKFEKLELGIMLPTTLQTKVTNYLTNASVPSNQKINPFLEWNLRIVAEFKDETNGLLYYADGFYFRNFERDEVNDKWTDLGTPYPFRIRFAPNLTGKWSCNIKVFVNDVLTYSSAPFNFTVLNWGNPGFVKIHSNGKNLARGADANLIFPVGTNLPCPGGLESGLMDYNGNPDYMSVYKMHYLKDYLNNVKAYSDAGGKYFRYIVSQPHSEIEFEKLGNYYDRLPFATEIDYLLDYAHEKDMLIHFALMLHKPIMKSADYGHDGWDFGDNNGLYPLTAYCYSSAFNTQTPSDMILNGTNLVDGHPAMDYQKQRYRYYISRYGYSTNIELFELLSEPLHMNEYKDANGNFIKPALAATAEGDIARAAITQFHTELAAYIKLHLQHHEHLIASQGRMPSTSAYALEPDSGPAFTVNETSWSNPYIDIASVSCYSGSPEAMINSKDNDNFGNDNNGFTSSEKSYAFSAHKVYEAYGKPMIIAETGVGDYNGTEFDGCSGYKMHEFVARRTGFTGIAGFNMWAGWVYGDPLSPANFDNHTVLWPSVLLVQNHMNGTDVTNILKSHWTQGREVQNANNLNKIREQQYYVSEDKVRCVGYIANRTYNVHTLNTISPSVCSTYNVGADFDDFVTIVSCTGPVGLCAKLEVQGLLENTSYQVDWYHYGTGAYYYSDDCVMTNGSGVWRMDHAVLDVNDPLLYYVIIKKSCTPGLAPMDDPGTMQAADSESVLLSGLSENTSNQWILSPNPTTETVFVSGNSLITICITDNKGQLVKNLRFNGESFSQIDLKDLQSGIYFVRINDSAYLYKLVKL